MKTLPLLARAVGYSLVILVFDQWLVFPERTIGRNTISALLSGVFFFGLMALITKLKLPRKDADKKGMRE